MDSMTLCKCGEPFEYISQPTPEPAGTEVLVEVMYCGVCHTDIHLWEGYYELGGGKRLTMEDRGIDLPLTLGHEIAGRVVRCGPLAQGVAVGDVRIVYPWIGCGACANCKAELEHMCLSRMRSLGVFRDGGYGSHVIVPAPKYLIDPDTIPLPLAATLACSGVTVFAAIEKILPLAPDDPVVVIGAGGLGLTAIDLLRAKGHRRTVAVDISPVKRVAALKIGAARAVDGAAEDATDLILAACGGPVRAAIDFVNGSKTARMGVDILAKGGKLVQVGLFGGDLTIALPMMTIKALTLQGSYIGSIKELQQLVALVKNGGMGSVPIEVEPKANAFTALMRLREGKVSGRLVLKSEAA